MSKPKGYWNNYENCYNEALKYKSRKSFKSGSNTAYEKARKNGWLDDYTWMPKPKDKHNGYWNYETCFSAAKLCRSISEFTKLYSGALDKARDKGWLKDYTWFVRPDAHNKKWTKETCEAEARKYKTLKEFGRKSGGAYMVAQKNSWIDDYTWLERTCVKKGYWQVFDNCYNEALKYKSRTEFQRKQGGCYNQARANGWLDKFDWLKDKRIDLIDGKIDSVYVYEFVNQHAAYIGRTLMRTQKERDKHHLFVLDSVSSFARDNDIPLPEMRILEDNLTLKEGIEREAFYIEKYKNEGWNVLNKAGAGSIGSLYRNRYTYNKCYDEAKKYTHYRDFVKESRTYYRVAYRNGWIVDYTWLIHFHRKHNYWNYETCMESAKLCTTMKEFTEKYSGAYDKARDNGWLAEYAWLIKKEQKPKGYWTYERCAEESKKYKTLAEWRMKNQTSYNKARDNGWMKYFIWINNNGQLNLFE